MNGVRKSFQVGKNISLSATMLNQDCLILGRLVGINPAGKAYEIALAVAQSSQRKRLELFVYSGHF